MTRSLANAALLALTACMTSASSAPARAQELADCDGPTPEMNACIFRLYEQADAELNELWTQVLATIRPSDFLPPEAAAAWRESLVAAQRAWVTFKEEDCNGVVAYEWYGGTGANAAVGACLYEKTVARIEDLRARYLDGRR